MKNIRNELDKIRKTGKEVFKRANERREQENQ